MAKRTAMITGCSSGIGEATAARLAKGGWTVYATARKPETLEGLAAAGCRTLALDVTREDSMADAVGKVIAEAGAIDALVNNAGYSQSGAVETLDLDDVRRQ
ncbi:MAG: SDR family NAD(P)-dependent oxidoreductase, partial [Aeromicrobium sp.]